MAKPQVKSIQVKKDSLKVKPKEEKKDPIDVFDMDVGQDQINAMFGVQTTQANEFGINYNEIGITTPELIEELNQCAYNMKYNYEKSTEHMLAFAKSLKQAQDALAKSGSPDGTFGKWYVQLGLDKSTVYRILDRYNLFISTKNDKAMTAPQNIITYFKKNEEAPSIVSRILSANSPTKAFRTYKKKDSDNTDIEALDEYARLEKQLQDIDDKIKELKEKKKKIRAKLDKLTKEEPISVE